MKVSHLIAFIFLSALNISCEKNKSSQIVTSADTAKNSTQKIDTIKRNSFITYSKTIDTLIERKDRFEISISTKNIENKYLIQYFNFDERKVIANYYPDKASTVIIKKNGNQFFSQIFYKSSFKKYFDMDVEKFILHDITVNSVSEFPNEPLSLKATLEAPNSDWSFDFLIYVLPNGQSEIKIVEYESE